MLDFDPDEGGGGGFEWARGPVAVKRVASAADRGIIAG